jgi:DNA helicase II / ATP-dependent DNA helicase PcrA
MENVNELINFASETEAELAQPSFEVGSPPPVKARNAQEEDDWEDRAEDEYDEEELDDLGFAEVKGKGPKHAILEKRTVVSDL